MITTKKITLTMAEKQYYELKKKADLADFSLNAYILKLLGKKRVFIVPGLQKLHSEVFQLHCKLNEISGQSEDVNLLIDEVRRLCLLCESLMAKIMKSIE